MKTNKIPLLNSAQVAEQLQISERHLFNLRMAEEIEWIQHGRLVRFTQDHVDTYIRKHSQNKFNPLKSVAYVRTNV